MRNTIRRLLKRPFLARIALFLAVVGPGIITASLDNDAGGITTYSLAGARFNYDLLWTLIPITIALIVAQEMCARMGAVTGKGLADLIRERYGVRVTAFALLTLLVANFGVTVAEFAGVASAMGIFGVPRFVSVPIAGILVWLLVVRGNYKVFERVLLFASAVYIAYPISGIMAGPQWGPVLSRLVIPPSIHTLGSSLYILTLIGFVGTTITPWMQFYLQAAVVEKGITVREYAYQKWDVIVGCVITDVVSFFIVIATAATIFKHHLPINNAADAARALAPLAGQYASLLFAVGLLNASLFSASVLPLSTSYLVCESLGFESGVGKKWREAPVFFTLYTALLVGPALVVIALPDSAQLGIMFLSQVANGMVLPLILIVMLLLINDRHLMGRYVNGRLYNVIAWTTSVIMIGLSTALLVTSLFPQLSF